VGDGGDPTLLATGLANPATLSVFGTSLYWFEDVQKPGTAGVIKRMATTGGAVSTVYTAPVSDGGSPSPLVSDLASDGTSLFFAVNSAPDGGFGPSVMKSALDGTSASMLAPGVTAYGAGNTAQNQMFFSGGNLYASIGFGAAVYQIDATSGTVTQLAAPDGFLVLLGADTNGLLFQTGNGASTGTDFYEAPLDLGSTTHALHLASGHQGVGMARSGANVVLASTAAAPLATSIDVFPSATPDAGVFADSAGFEAQALVGDGNGVYTGQSMPGHAAYPLGVYTVSSTGALTMKHATSSGVLFMALDATNVYWIDGAGVHALAR
jgi:hypothetical protein